MDIICKVCNHEINDHLPDGCFHCENGTLSVNETCSCELSPADVANVEITLLQARLDTNRAQVEALIAERDALKNKLRGWLSGLDCWADEKGIDDLNDMMEEMQEVLS